MKIADLDKSKLNEIAESSKILLKASFQKPKNQKLDIESQKIGELLKSFSQQKLGHGTNSSHQLLGG
ncbi:hypothetical protein COB52_00250 [Candidatus Kaiserbacteria bacterium]|nr:MAG: hypothetical protein COB52_00250 [Candidatus Kaiserbacteria bacterium]